MPKKRKPIKANIGRPKIPGRKKRVATFVAPRPKPKPKKKAKA